MQWRWCYGDHYTGAYQHDGGSCDVGVYDDDDDDDDDDDGVDDDGDDDEEQMMGNWRGGAKGLLRGAREESVDGTISISFW